MAVIGSREWFLEDAIERMYGEETTEERQELLQDLINQFDENAFNNTMALIRRDFPSEETVDKILRIFRRKKF